MGTTQRYLMFFSYIGSAFRGSQLQHHKSSNIETVQYALETGLKNVFKVEDQRPFCVHLASRTDAGVHALKAVMSVDLPKYRNRFLNSDALKNLMNSYFKKNKDIRILEVHIVPDTVKFREFCLSKTYLYRIGVLKTELYEKHAKSITPTVEIGRTHILSSTEFDVKKVEEAASLFEGRKDFGAILGKPSKNTCPTICNIMSYTIEKAQPFFPVDPISQRYDYYHLICEGDRFLHHMVRRMVSLVLAVGFSKLALADIKKLFDEPVPSSWPRATPPQVPGYGLYLINTNIDLQQLMQKAQLLENTSEKVETVNNSEIILKQ